MDKPKDILEYKNWLKKNHEVIVDDRIENYYDSVSHKILKDFNESEFWNSLCSKKEPLSQKYLLDTKFDLFAKENNPELIIKPFNSFLLKTFRKNIINNNDWPNPPGSDWILPNNWYAKINDIIRTCFSVKYLDGVQFFIDNLKELCKDNNLDFLVDFEAKEEGYYAAHTYIIFPCEIPTKSWTTIRMNISIELQITTQLQEVIKKLLHRHYGTRRKNIEKSELKWQWDYKSDEFAANYLGHILHYVEGMIMDVRSKQEGGK